MNIQLISQDNKENLKDLYLEAFPLIERKPFDLLLSKEKEGKAQLLSILMKDKFVGLVILLRNKKNVLLDYFAISESARSQNIGSQVIAHLKEKYKQENLIFEIESTQTESKDIDVRKKREKFYLKNGLVHLNHKVFLNGVEMMIMGNKKTIHIDDYLEIYRNVLGFEFVQKNIQLITTN